MIQTMICPADKANLFRDYIRNRGGILVWRNKNMSSSECGSSVSTPATIPFKDCNHHGDISGLKLICPHCMTEIRQENAGEKPLLHCTVCSRAIGELDFLIAYPSPHWSFTQKPERLIKDEAEIVVEVAKEVGRVPVKAFIPAPKLESMRVNLGAQHNKNCWYQFDTSANQAVFFVTEKLTPLDRWKS